MRGCKDFSRSTAFDKTGRRIGIREGFGWFSQSREVLEMLFVVGRVSSRLVGSGAPIFWSSMEASTADFLQGKLDDRQLLQREICTRV